MTSKEWNEVIREDARRGKYDPTWMYVNNVVADLAAAEGRIAELEAAALRADAWVSVKERLPENSGSVLIFGDRCEVYIAKWYGDENVGWYSDYGEPVDVTHWRPLPPAPEQKT